MFPASRHAVVPALLACLAPLSLGGCRSRPHQKIPVIAFTVAQHAVIDLTKGADDFADTLSKYFGTTHSEGLKVIDYVDEHNDRNLVAADAARTVGKSLEDIAKKPAPRSRDEFAVEVMAPFLQFVLHGNELAPDLQRKILDRYARTFALRGGVNGLSTIASSIRSYQTGGSFHADSLNLFNAQIIPGGYLFQIDNRNMQACLLDIVDTILPARKWRDSTLWIVEVGRAAPCYLGSDFGYSTTHCPYVVVVKDRIRQEADEIRAQVDTSWHGTFHPDKRFSQRVWRSIGLEMPSDEADRILLSLLRRDFHGKGAEEIALLLQTETAIHEAKHKTDDIDLPAMTLNSDCEVSAHLTQAICGNTPYHGLFDAIQRINGFYAGSGDPILGTLLFQLWNIAKRAQSPSFGADSLRAQLAKTYSLYVAESSRSRLPPLDGFRDSLAPAIRDGMLRCAAKPSSSR
jgi:hypothetical protein